jgi:GntR family transcriptional repressor for pyruvate dehydrogenase complex
MDFLLLRSDQAAPQTSPDYRPDENRSSQFIPCFSMTKACEVNIRLCAQGCILLSGRIRHATGKANSRSPIGRKREQTMPTEAPSAVARLPESRRLYQQVADRIRVLIAGGSFPAGSRLPAERDLAQQLGVSRPSLREALIALEIDGSVDIRMGSGVYVTAAAAARGGQMMRPMGESPLELMQARAVIEGAVAALAAARATHEDIAGLRDCLAAMRTEIDAGRWPLGHDRQFHVSIAAMAGNSILTRLIGELFDERYSPISTQLSGHFESREAWALALAEHEAIVEELEAGDPLQTEAAMRFHMQSSKRRWTRD